MMTQAADIVVRMMELTEAASSGSISSTSMRVPAKTSGAILAKGRMTMSDRASIQPDCTSQTSPAPATPSIMRIAINRRRLPAKSETMPIVTPKTRLVSVETNMVSAKPWPLIWSVSMATSAMYGCIAPPAQADTNSRRA